MTSQSRSAASGSLPTLDIIDPSSPPNFTKPVPRIIEGPDVSHFLTSLAYRDIGAFILQLNHSLCPRQRADSPLPRLFPLPTTQPETPSIVALQTLLSNIEKLMDDAPPDPGPRRFGNVSFRKWYALLEAKQTDLLRTGLLGETLQLGNGSALEEVVCYLHGAFGSAQRLDYGTGHELSFIAFLGCLWKLGYFKDERERGEIEREIVLSVIEPYLRVVRKLIQTYNLEPAGSHGVWGLDDHSFVPYIFGSAQLTRPINNTEPMPTEGSVKGAPKPADVVKESVVQEQRQINMYFSAIGFINDVKKGPFWEHSSILFNISGIRDGWGKINKGMIKMFNAEVLSKFPVVQHFPFGSLFSWDADPEAAVPTQSVHTANQPARAMPPPPAKSGTGAPWAQSTAMPSAGGPGIPYPRQAPGPGSASLRGRGTRDQSAGVSSPDAQLTVTKAPWAKDG
ncbi:hypothetical protein S40285_05951 [Stachybotrys chlorohalonatus IBT 40285]|uniref:Serine/threonine-protein phosphatase 2A activator n=1 Tax=Stachybotrys chlorohalonatus (strain IBT 40285) TaxID=1283841 RepID=A0A084QVD6_STAC4|nr:hypothetical protein S40285_05951 [Stachybotrys chlorohalonata IBT 40285]